MTGIDDAAKLLGAASSSDDPHWTLVLIAEAEIVLAREADRIAELRLLLGAMRGEFLRTATTEQRAILAKGS